MDVLDVNPLYLAPVELALDHLAVVPYPVYAQATTRVHSGYHRTVAHLPWQSLYVRLILETRRFLCDTIECVGRIFTERFPTTVAPYGRRMRRAVMVFDAIEFGVDGRAGARLAAALDFDVALAARIIAALRAVAELRGRLPPHARRR